MGGVVQVPPLFSSLPLTAAIRREELEIDCLPCLQAVHIRPASSARGVLMITAPFTQGQLLPSRSLCSLFSQEIRMSTTLLVAASSSVSFSPGLADKMGLMGTALTTLKDIL